MGATTEKNKSMKQSLKNFLQSYIKTNGFILEFENDEWRADAKWQSSDYKGVGATPEEAVVILWFALQKYPHPVGTIDTRRS